MSLKTRYIDLSHIVEDGVVTYKGLPAPIICDYLSREESRSHYAEGTEFQIDKIEMVGNTGTYLDSPFHRYADGIDISQLDLTQLAGLDAVCVRTTHQMIDADVFQGLDVKGKAVLVHTNHSHRWKTDAYFENHPYLTKAAAEWLRDQGAVLVGIDSLNIDSMADGNRPVHSTLLGAGVLIVEHLTNLDSLPQDVPFKFYAVPVKVKQVGTFPVRSFAAIQAEGDFSE